MDTLIGQITESKTWIIGWKQVSWWSTATVSKLSDQMRYSTISTRKEWPIPHELPKYTFQVSTHRFLHNPWLVHCFRYWWKYDFPFNKLIFPPISFLQNIDDGQENHTIWDWHYTWYSKKIGSQKVWWYIAFIISLTILEMPFPSICKKMETFRLLLFVSAVDFTVSLRGSWSGRYCL